MTRLGNQKGKYGDLEEYSLQDTRISIRKGLFLFLILAWSAAAFAQPTISSFSPTSGNAGITVAVNGTGFNSTPSNNIVYFGSVKATVTGGTTSQLQVTVPKGTTYQPITVTSNGLTGSSRTSFITTFASDNIIKFAAQDNLPSPSAIGNFSISDFDGDGKSDVISTYSLSSNVSVIRTTSAAGSAVTATKQDFTAGSSNGKVAIGDLDGDGKQDMAVTNTFASSVSIFRNTSVTGTISSGSFTFVSNLTTGSNPVSVSIGDLDGDGKPDLAVNNEGSNNLSLFLNATTGSAITFTALAPLSVNYFRSLKIADIDGDGKRDIISTGTVANMAIGVLLNTSSAVGTISFAAQVNKSWSGTLGSISSALGDIDGDGKLDVAFIDTNSSNVVIYQNSSTSGSVSFVAKPGLLTGTGPVSVSIGDMDGDSRVDLVTYSNSNNKVSILRNLGSGSFSTNFDFVCTGSHPPQSTMEIGDVDGDGKLDVVVGGGYLFVLRNQTKAAQSITFNAITSMAYGSASFDLDTYATASSGLPITYTSSNPTAATVDAAGVVTITGVGATTFTASQPGDNNYNSITNTQILAVTKKALTMGGVSAADKVYNGNTTAILVGTPVLFGVLAGDDVTLNASGATATFASANIGSNLSVTYSGYTLSGTKANNYTLTQPSSSNSNNITAAPLTLTGLVVSNKIYDANKSATILTQAGIASGIISGDNVALNTSSAIATFSTKAAGLRTVTTTGYTLTGTSASNYVISAMPTATATITPKTVTISGLAVNNKIYDGTANAFINDMGTLSGVIVGDNAIINQGTAVFSDKNVGTGKAVTTSGFTLISTDAGNYTIAAQPTTIATITARAITVTPLPGQSKVYGASDPAFNYNLSMALYAGDAFTGTLGRVVGENVGTYTINPGTLSLGSNYSITFGTNGYLVITAKPITVTADAGQSKIYGDADPVLTYTFTPALVPGDVFSGSLDRGGSTGAGTYAIYQGTLRAGGNSGFNYSISYVINYFTILKRAVTVTINAGQSKIYGASEPVLTYTHAPALIGFDTFLGALARDAGNNVGSYAINQGSLTAGLNYAITFASFPTFAVTPKPITVTANGGQAKVYGTVDPVFIYSTSPNLISGDVFTGALTRAVGTNAGTYAIAIGSLSAGTNYNLTFVSSNFLILPANVYVYASVASKTYGSADPALNYTSNPSTLIAGNSFTGSLGRNVGESVGTYAINQGTLSAGTNYSIIFNTSNLIIDKKSVTITGTTVGNKTYDGTVSATITNAGSLTGIISPDVLTIIQGSAVFNLANAANGRLVTFNGFSISGTDASNYVLAAQPPVTTADITPKPITISATAGQSKVYGNSDPQFTYSSSPGLLNGDQFTGQLGRVAGEDAGTYPITLGFLQAGATSANYQLILSAPVNFTITPRVVTVTATAGQSKTYGDTDPVFTYSSSPALLSGNAFSGALSRTPGENVGGYVLNQGTLSVTGNYTLSFASNNFAIAPKVVTVTATVGQSKSYGEADPVFTYSFSPALLSGNGFSGALSRSAGENVGGYILKQGTLSVTGNYTISFTSNNFGINPKAITITVDAGQNKVYGANDPVFTYSVAPALLTGDSFTGSLARTAGNNAGTYAITQGSLIAGSNYLINFSSSAFTITKAVLTLNADAKARAYATSNPILTGTFTGFVNGDDASVINGTPLFTTTADVFSSVAGSPYSIHGDVNTATAANYQIVYGNDASLTINKADQIITFNPLIDKNKTDPPFDLSATAELPVTFTLLSGPASINGTTLTLDGTAGTVQVVASQAGDANYNAASSVMQNFEVNNKSAAILNVDNFSLTMGASGFALDVTSNSSGVVSYLILPGGTGIATLNNSQLIVSRAGTVNLRITVTSDNDYNGTYKDVVVTINKRDQVIPDLALKTTYDASDAPIQLPANTNGNLAITYISSDETIARISNGNTLQFEGGVGEVTITANQAGDENNTMALEVKSTFIVMGNQSISFNTLPVMKYGDNAYTLSASGGLSGNVVQYTSSNTGVATINGAVVSIVGAGTTTITASQAGSTTYHAAADVPRTLQVDKADQKITFDALPSMIAGAAPYPLAATSSSGLLITYTTSDESIAITTNDSVLVKAAGTVTITARQEGSTNYNAAAGAEQLLTVTDSRIISVSDTLRFGNNIVNVDNPSATFTISNKGTGALTLTAINLPDGFTADKTSGVISAGESMIINLTFTPVVAKDYTGIISITSDATSGAATLVVNATGVLVTALEYEDKPAGIVVYPNPSRGIFTLEITKGDTRAVLINLDGIMQEVTLEAVGGNLYKLDLTDAIDGTYVLRCKSGDATVHVRLIKIN